MKKFIIVSVVSLLVGLGLGLAIPHGANQNPQSQSGERLAGGSGGVQLDRHFTYGLYAGLTDQFAVTSTGTIVSSASVSAATFQTATIGASSSSPAALGSASAGHFVIAAGATTLVASTTSITANSSVSVNLEKESPIAGVTCNSTVNASSSPIQVNKVAGSGFVATIPSAPVTNPFCYNYRITN